MLGTEMLRTIIKVVFTSHLAKEEEDKGDHKVDAAREHAQREEESRDEDSASADHGVSSRVFHLDKKKQFYRKNLFTI
jgi:hypothetical protein